MHAAWPTRTDTLLFSLTISSLPCGGPSAEENAGKLGGHFVAAEIDQELRRAVGLDIPAAQDQAALEIAGFVGECELAAAQSLVGSFDDLGADGLAVMGVEHDLLVAGDAGFLHELHVCHLL